MSVSGVTMDGVEVKSGTAATITCKMTGLTAEKPLTVTWLNGDGSDIGNDQGITLVPTDGSPGKCYSGNAMIKRKRFPFPICHLTFFRDKSCNLRDQRLSL